MTSSNAFLRTSGWAGAALLAFQLGACATAPPKFTPPDVATLQVPEAPAAVVTMAPIANPSANVHERRTASRSHAGGASAKHTHTAKTAAATAAVTPSAPAGADPGRAAQLRAHGLEELDRGSVNHAVGLLAQASQLDPSNPVIRRDLDRAERIAKTVHGSR